MLNLNQLFDLGYWSSLIASPWTALLHLIDISIVAYLIYNFSKAIAGTKIMTLIRGVFLFIIVQIVASIFEKHSAFVGQIVNVSSGNSIRLKDIVEELKSLLSSTSMIEYGKIPYRENEVMDLNCNIEKLEKLMGKKMNISTLNRMRDFVKE